MEEAGLRIALNTRFMDGGTIFLHPLKRGRRWLSGELIYSKQWEIEDVDRSQMDVTLEAIRCSMEGISSYQTGADFEDGWLPTLDTNMVVDPTSKVLYKYFEKTSTTNTTILKSTEIDEIPKIKSLSNDLVRRLLTTRREIPDEYKAEVEKVWQPGNLVSRKFLKNQALAERVFGSFSCTLSHEDKSVEA